MNKFILTLVFAALLPASAMARDLSVDSALGGALGGAIGGALGADGWPRWRRRRFQYRCGGGYRHQHSRLCRFTP